MINISCSSLKNKTSQNKIYFTRISTYSGNSSWNVLVSFWPNIFFYFFLIHVSSLISSSKTWFIAYCGLLLFFCSYSSLMIHVIGLKS